MLKSLISTLLLVCLLSSCFIVYYVAMPMQKTGDKTHWTWYFVPHSTLSHQIRGQDWQTHIAHPQWFTWLVQVLGQDQKIKPGAYAMDGTTTPFALMQALSQGKVIQHAITLVEGASWRDLRPQLSTFSRYADYGEPLSEKALLTALKCPHASLEGLLFPSTYHWNWLTHDQDAYAQAYRLMDRHLKAAWEGRAHGLPYQKPYDLLIAASLIEREVRLSEERALVSAVIVNRLRKKMRLQIEATVLYGLGRSSGRVRYKDLKKDTPYNTYLHGGLPPTPIALPSLASLEAAGHPEKSDVLYYVLCDDAGHHCFSSAWSAHQKAVRMAKRKVK
jgi:UPF0755 protein